MTACISVSGLGKRFRIHHEQRPRYLTFRETLGNSVRALGARAIGLAQAGTASEEELWALRDVNFEIGAGERIGIIGGNGAGKSTLLKILGRVTAPTSGKAVIRGRMASLLEVGTGFHPELTGRENIFLNGAVLGMQRAEIARKFDEIIAFAEIERFVDVPVKWYSSGMYVRLAFAIAAHLDSDILVVDEVLAVGDIQFQKKCIQKMEGVTTDGRTVLLVSHSMSTILGLSTKCMLLTAGELTLFDHPDKVIQHYQRSFRDAAFGRTDLAGVERYGNGAARFTAVQLTVTDAQRNVLPSPATGCDLEIRLTIEAKEELRHATVAVTIYDEMGVRLIDANTLTKGQSVSIVREGRAVVCFRLRNLRLRPDVYTVGLWMGVENSADIDGVRYATSFRSEARKEDVLYAAPFPGPYACEFESRVEISGVDAMPGSGA